MQTKSSVFDGLSHLKNIPTNSPGVGIVSVGCFFFGMLEMIDGRWPLAFKSGVL